MKAFRTHLLVACLAPSALLAVYAPIPEQEQGKAWTVGLSTGIGYDSNLFGASSGEISSDVESISARVAFNASLDKQSFLSAYYAPRMDYQSQRPGDKTLDSHEAYARLAHTFSPDTNAEVSDFFQRSRNPQSLLNGLPLNTEQSFCMNQFDARSDFGLGERSAALVKFRNLAYWYDEAALADSLDRLEYLYGLSLSRNLQPKLSGVFEYRHQDIRYRSAGNTKDKRSDFALLGADYKPGGRLNASFRLGVEQRHRRGEDEATAPSSEFTLKYAYSKGSHVAAGLSYGLEECSDTDHFNDSLVTRGFVNLQQALSPLLTLSGSVSYEPAVLQGRGGQPDIDESTLRTGVACSWLPTKNWLLSLSVDFDQVWSYYDYRELLRTRTGVSAGYTF